MSSGRRHHRKAKKTNSLHHQLKQALKHLQLGQNHDALALYQTILQDHPNHFESWNLSGVAMIQAGQPEQGLKQIERALEIDSNNAYAHFNRGNALFNLNRLPEAVQSYQQAIALSPEYADAWFNLGNTLLKTNQPDEAAHSFEQVIKIAPHFSAAYTNLGKVFMQQKQPQRALECYEKVLIDHPNMPELHNNRGNALKELKRYEDALSSYDRALMLNPNYVEAYSNKSTVLLQLESKKTALACCNKALELNPNYSEAYFNRGNILFKLNQSEAAISDYKRALELKTDQPLVHYALGNTLKELKRLNEAVESYQTTLTLEPDMPYLLGTYLYSAMQICQWNDFDKNLQLFEQKIHQNSRPGLPFPALILSDKPELHQKLSRSFIQSDHPSNHTADLFPPSPPHSKIRIAYYSADFCHHPVTQVMIDVYEAHDKNRFEWYAFSFTPDKNKLFDNLIKERVISAFDHFIEVNDKSDREVAQLSRELGIDIAIDLGGFTMDARTGIFAEGCAPIQVNYLGYPGTLAADYMDYIIVDKTIIPPEHQSFFTEQVAYLPHSYLVNGELIQVSEKQWTRQDFGLPNTGFVFCCFNNNGKILPATFDGWMRILKAVPDSVLWLKEDNLTAATNLRHAAEIRGVESERLIFAGHGTPEEYLARRRMADLFLDTFPYNAHATAADALKIGLPILTLMGQSFASRVAASFLQTLGYPELITTSQADYEAKAIELATQPEKLANLRQGLGQTISTSPLFDALSMAHHLEILYTTMYERYQNGLSPEVIEVPAEQIFIPKPSQKSFNITQQFQQAISLLQSGQFIETLNLLQRILQQNPGHVESWHLSGIALIQSGKPEQGLKHIDQALQLNPNHAVAHCNRGNALFKLGQFEAALDSYDYAIKLNPRYAEAHYNRGNTLLQLQRSEEALQSYTDATVLKPDYAEAHNNRANLLLDAKQFTDALKSYEAALNSKPHYAEAHNNRGNTLLKLNRPEEALVCYEQALKINPGYLDAYYNCSNALIKLNRFEDALIQYNQVLQHKPDFAEAYHKRGHVLFTLNRPEDALADLNQALAIQPESIEALLNRGNILLSLQDIDEAMADFNQALQIKPDHVDALIQLGNAWLAKHELEKALEYYERVLQIQPDCPEAYYNKGNAFKAFDRFDEALESYQQAIRVKPDSPEAYFNQGNGFKALNRFDEAIECYQQAIRVKPDYFDAYYNLANTLRETKHFDEALILFEKLFNKMPTYRFLIGTYLYTELLACQWQNFNPHFKRFNEMALQNHKVGTPFVTVLLTDDPDLQKINTYNYVKTKHPKSNIQHSFLHKSDDTIRIGYYSADLRQHPVAEIMADVFKAHDKSQFEWFGFSLKSETNDPIYHQMSDLFDHFYDVSDKKDEEIAQISRDLGIDIAIDLNGYTQYSRTSIFASGCAPIQVNYLGYPGTMAADYIDYIIADKTLIPPEQSSHFTEQVVYLPDSYLVKGDAVAVSERQWSRQDFDLPESGFIFCCFNSNFKILPSIFATWMRILSAVPNSVLWLREDNATAAYHLRQEAESYGIDAKRLIFAQHASPDEYLARRQMADLFLDTFPYNAHATAADALKAGLPVLTLIGRSFASRVGASLLNTLRCPELITTSPAEYEKTAIELATQPGKLELFRNRLQQQASSSPLFNAPLMARYLETAYQTMYARYRNDLPPETFEIKSTHQPDETLKTTDPQKNTINPQLQQAITLLKSGKFLQALDLFNTILQQQPDHVESWHLSGIALLQMQKEQDALTYFDKAIRLEPENSLIHSNKGHALLNLNRLEESLQSYDQAIKLNPEYTEAYYNRGNILLKLDRQDEALHSFGKAIQLNPQYAKAFFKVGNLYAIKQQLDKALANYEQALQINPNYLEASIEKGNVLLTLNRLQEAEASYKQVLHMQPDCAEAYNNLGNVFMQLKQPENALAYYQQAIALRPDFSEALNNCGNALSQMDKIQEAQDIYQHALTQNPEDPDTYYNLANLMNKSNQLDNALLNYNKALQIKPDHIQALLNRANLLTQLRHKDAISAYDHLIALAPEYAEAYYNKGNALVDQGHLKAAQANYQKALEINPNLIEALFWLGNILKDLKEYEESLLYFEKAIKHNPDYKYLIGAYLYAKSAICNWTFFDYPQRIIELTEQNKAVSPPFPLLVLFDNLPLQAKATHIYTSNEYPNFRCMSSFDKHASKKTIRVGYYSSDFRNHPVARAMVDIFENHDKKRFEWYAFSLHQEDNHPFRQRLVNAFEHFIDVQNKSDTEIAQLSRELGIDIAVNLNGYTQHARTGIFAAGCAPIQVNYLGYPGTMGAEYMDYIIADKTLIPTEYQPYFTEQVVHLPHSYLVNAAQLDALTKEWTRQDCGLPDTGFVFCCFNSNSKILPATFDGWMRILKAVPDSVLWLKADNEIAAANLHKEAADRGVDSERLIFTRYGSTEEYLARRQTADLFLDTFPYNAHATAADALKAGLPVLTLMGESFASRVAASFLNTLDCPELITTSQADYEAKAIELALNPELLKSIKQKLIENRDSSPLFDATLMARHLETAYQAMYDRYQQGLSPDVIEVQPCIVSSAEKRTNPEQSIPETQPTLTVAQQLQQAITQLQSRQTAQALTLLQNILQQHPDHVESWHLSGIALIQSGQPEQGLQHLDQAVLLKPDHAVAHCNRGNALFSLGRFEDALNSYNKALSLNPRYAEAYYNRGNTFVQMNRAEEALDSYTQATKLKPDYAEAYNNKGNILLKERLFTDALNSFDQALNIKPDYAETHNNKGNTLLKLHRLEEALLCYERALQINPQYIDAYYNCGNTLVALDRLEAALNHYNHVLQHKPGFYEAYNKRGHILFTLNRCEDALIDFNQALTIQPTFIEALTNRGNVLLSLNRTEEAISNFNQVVQLDDRNVNALIQLGNAWLANRQLDKALESYEKILQIQPDCPEAYYNKGNAFKAFDQFDEAINCYRQAIRVKPDYFDAYYNLANTLVEAKQFEESLTFFKKGLQLRPNSAPTHNNMGNTLLEMKQEEDALICYTKAIAIQPDFYQALNNIGAVLLRLKRYEDALAQYNQAIAIKPDYVDAHTNKANTLIQLKRQEEALLSCENALKLKPDSSEAYEIRGEALNDLKRYEEAILCHQKALSLNPKNANTYNFLGIAYLQTYRYQEAIACYDKALSIDSSFFEAHINKANTFRAMKRLDDALASYIRAMDLKPDYKYLFGYYLNTLLNLCQWEKLDQHLNFFHNEVLSKKPIGVSFQTLIVTDNIIVHKTSAQIYVSNEFPNSRNMDLFVKPSSNNKIRIGYYSSDFRNHPIAQIMEGIFEAHNQSQFEWYAFSLVPENKQDFIYQRLPTLFTQFIDVQNKSDAEVAELSRELGIDIAINLNGYTEHARTGIFAHGCAPIQVNYLGYPGTMATEYIDYIIADKTLIPPEQQEHFTEQVVYLPYSYLVNGEPLVPLTKEWNRQDLGLPETGFVFCCFNNNAKILPATFGGWMRILTAVPGSVLWLKADNETAVSNLRQEAQARGVDAERLVFAGYGSLEEYLARRQMADLFLDTFPYNAHATACDALKAGLPILTLMGQSFASRVAASLLKTVECPELITTSQADYEAKAIELANNPDQLAEIRQRLEQNRLTSPLFDSTLMARHLEAAYQAMYERYQQGLNPQEIIINP